MQSHPFYSGRSRFFIVLLAAFLSACGSNPATSTVRAKPTTATTPAQAAPTGTTFRQLTGSNFKPMLASFKFN
jgi:hypothetical protein